MNRIKIFFKKNIIRIIGLIIFIVILLNINFKQTIEILSGIKLTFIFVLLTLSVIKTILKSFRLLLTLKIININYSIKNSIIITYIANFIGSITPGNIGDLIKIFYIKKDKNISSVQPLLGLLYQVNKFFKSEPPATNDNITNFSI